jgi:hypothetical protein
MTLFVADRFCTVNELLQAGAGQGGFGARAAFDSARLARARRIDHDIGRTRANLA